MMSHCVWKIFENRKCFFAEKKNSHWVSFTRKKYREKEDAGIAKMIDFAGKSDFRKEVEKLSENFCLFFEVFFAKIWSKRTLILWESVLFNGFVKYSAIWCLFCFDLTFLDETYLKVELLPWVWVYFYNWSAFLELNFCWERESGNIYILTRLYLTLFDASRIFSPRICRLSAWGRDWQRNKWFETSDSVSLFLIRIMTQESTSLRSCFKSEKNQETLFTNKNQLFLCIWTLIVLAVRPTSLC